MPVTEFSPAFSVAFSATPSVVFSSAFSRVRTRTAAGRAFGAVAVATALLAVAGGPACATGTAADLSTGGPAAGRTVRTTDPGALVDSFLTEYRLAVLGEIDPWPRDVRRAHLSPALNLRLDDWESRSGADPVFRARASPASWSVRQAATAPGRSSVRLTEHWGDGTAQDVWYGVRLADGVITDLGDTPAF